MRRNMDAGARPRLDAGAPPTGAERLSRGWTPVRPLRRTGVAFFRTRLARYIPPMILALCVVLAAAAPAPHDKIVAVLPIEGGAFDAGAASTLESEVRAAVADVLGAESVVPAEAQRGLLAGTRLAPADAARKLSATHVLTATTRRMEGALAVSWSLVSSEGKSVGTARLVGFTPAEVRAEARAKIDDLLREAFGMAAPRRAAVGGTLRIPAAAPAQPATSAPAAPVPP